MITESCDFSFPKDHGAHPEHRIEWWYYTGNLASRNDRAFGFQLTFFRTRLGAPGSLEDPGPLSSQWRTPQLYMAHFAISDLQNKDFRYAKRAMRGAMDLAGAGQDSKGVLVFLEDWFARIDTGKHKLYAYTQDMGLELELQSRKPLAVHGKGGYSRKGQQPESASCYYSFTRLEAAGSIRLGPKEFTVQGQAWMDQEYSSNLLEAGLSGWDWFGLQLDDGWEIMAFQLRADVKGLNRGLQGWAGGSLISPEGKVISLEAEAIKFRAGRTWASPDKGAVYPLEWDIQIPEYEISLEITPRMQNQELLADPVLGGISYWEGAVQITGQRAGNPVSGLGYAELTGYAGQVPLVKAKE